HAEPGLNDADALAGLRPGICNVRTAGVGHFNQLLAADEVNRLIDAFVADVAPAEPEPSADGS
ncbi:MAG TPA: hypothetical protein VE991_06380, partial [Acidimicrobiales bacterium]|nr:hypothetical protein [Acidimicrobiales bacterium]